MATEIPASDPGSHKEEASLGTRLHRRTGILHFVKGKHKLSAKNFWWAATRIQVSVLAHLHTNL